MITAEVLGTVGADGTLHLDQKLNVPPGRVRIRVEAVPASPPGEGLMEFVERTRREREASGSRFMTGEEADAWIAELRDDGDRIEEIYRLAEEATTAEKEAHR